MAVRHRPCDAQVSTRALTDTLGSVTDTYAYNAFGDLHTQTGTTANPYLYTGQRYNATTEQYYLRAREYDPAVGRFLSRDTWAVDTWNPVELNRYVYAAANPVMWSDPSGHSAFFSNAQKYLQTPIGIKAASEIGKAVGRYFAGILGRKVTFYLVRVVVDAALREYFDQLYETDTREAGINDAKIRNALEAVDYAESVAQEIKNSGRSCSSTMYRVQGGSSRQVFTVDNGSGKLNIPGLRGLQAAGIFRVYVSFDNAQEVRRWLLKNRTGANVTVISIKIDRRFVEVVRAAAYEQDLSTYRFSEIFGELEGTNLRRNLPDIADPSTSRSEFGQYTSFGIPISWWPAMLVAMCPNTAKLETREQFLSRAGGLQ